MKIRKKYVAGIVLLLVACWFVSDNYFQLMLIQGNSMSPAYHNMQLVVLDKRCSAYQTGDVIAFYCDGLSAFLVKRVAAVPGETVVIQAGTLFVDQKKSPLYDYSVFLTPGLLSEQQQLPDDAYIVIGDNLNESIDSRDARVGIVHVDAIIGRVLARSDFVSSS